ncbi:cation-transporting ATPase pma1 [Brachionus plicatilis]|uniref:Cation-transporting ATPase pma1 n=1 Tax=Brachionus plicatilis TaxID=10195 RepID=A0A3M7R390_BRAPC|nr:cation-transporting ATPase pma1 [Brachionus plicatilis]
MIAFIPEGLPVCVTLSLLIIAKRMAKNRVLVKNLSVIETLSCVNVIASDKTGTLTQNKMFVASAAYGTESVDFSNVNQERPIGFEQLIASSCLCNNATFDNDAQNQMIPLNQKNAIGDATDIAMLKFSTQYEKYSNIRQKYALLGDIPFNSRNKWMVKVVKPLDRLIHESIFGLNDEANEDIVLIKGAPDYLLKKTTTILEKNGGQTPLNNQIISQIIRLQNEWCIQGQRVLVVCKRKVNYALASQKENFELENFIHETNDFCLVGLVGIIDPPREGIADVISKLKEAGIKVLMVTGDYALTAAAIAVQIGIFTVPDYDTLENMRIRNKENRHNYDKKALLLTGSDIENMLEDDWRLVTLYKEIVFARTTPEQKLRTVKEFQKDKYVVGVTGDGVNDAPALKSADIGIAMGGGSEVAMEASELVLLDNNFSSILIAIRNGRLVFYNLKKVILYLLPGGCFAELIPVLMSIFIGVAQNISSFQMLIISLFTDIAPSLSLMMEKEETDLLKQPPRSRKDHLVDWKFLLHAYLFLGLLIVLSSQCLFFFYMYIYSGLSVNQIIFSFDKLSEIYNETRIDGIKSDVLLHRKFDEIYFRGQTVTFVSIVLLQLFGNLLSTRTNRNSFFTQLPWKKKTKNFYIFAAQFISCLIMIIVVYAPVFNRTFNTRPIQVQFLFLPILFSLVIFLADELRKLMVRRKFIFLDKIAW